MVKSSQICELLINPFQTFIHKFDGQILESGDGKKGLNTPGLPSLPPSCILSKTTPSQCSLLEEGLTAVIKLINTILDYNLTKHSI